MALIAVCLTVTFVICGRANEGSGEQSEREGGMQWQVKEGSVEESEWEGVCAHLVCHLQICWCGSRSFPSLTLLIYLIYLNHPPPPNKYYRPQSLRARACPSTTLSMLVCVGVME